MGLKTKFNLVMLSAFLLGLSLAAVLSYKLVQDNARREVLEEAAIMMSGASAISAYTDHEIAPLLTDQVKVRFLPQTIPFWAAQTNFHSVQRDFPDYSFREPALNPTNPADRPTDWQADIIEEFRRNPKKAELISERRAASGPILSLSRPIKVNDQGCLACHSTPSAAPASLIDLYGSASGFGWKLGDIVGAQIVSVPEQVALDRANRTFILFIGGLAAVFLAMIALLNILLHYMIIRPVTRISATASEVSMGNMSMPEYMPKGRDEIASLAESFNRMRRSLANAMRMLDP
jgi:protein-histidine pros-kinase